jgi:hypothetical protein
MDQIMLGFATFFMGDIIDDQPKQYPSLLWLYFTPPSIRAVCYGGFATKIVADWLIFGKEFKIHRMIAAGLFAYTCTKMSISTVKNVKSKMSGWQTTATTGMGWKGSWWFGGGDGEWFGFVGHNGEDEKTILPASLLEQMSVKRDQEVDIVEMEELDETA